SPRVSVPEARILAAVGGSGAAAGGEEWSFAAHGTSGELQDREIRARGSAASNRSATESVEYVWLPAAAALYNLPPGPSPREFLAGPDAFIVLEPLRQVNASALARSLHCPKPLLDQIRGGRGDTTVNTLKGMVIHNM